MKYVPLWLKTTFSFLEGASDPAEFVEETRRLGLPALAVTDRDGVAGVVRAHVAALETGTRLIVGSEFTVAGGSTVVLLAQDGGGYANLCRLATKGRLRSPKGTSEATWDEVASHAPGLVALARGPDELPALKDAFADRLFALVARHRVAAEVRPEEILRRAAARCGAPVVAANEVLYHVPARRDLQDVMTCIRHGVTLATAGRLLRPNDGHALLSPFEMRRLFDDDPAALRRTLEIAERCTFSLAQIRYRYPTERLPDGTTSSQQLRRLTHEGAAVRYPDGVPDAVRAQIDRELQVIDALDYPGYFLTMHEIVRFCRERGILCQGRGSAANSAVCFCLGVTAVDPVRMDFLFERFLSMERAEPPDIDLDIEHDRREEAIQHVYAKYGRDKAAMVANVIRYRPRSALRDVGKALGIQETTLDRVSRLVSHHDCAAAVGDAAFSGAGLDPRAPVFRTLMRLVEEIQEAPRHLSIHPGGFLLGHEPVHDLVPIENATMEGRTVIQWDKDDVEALGLFKVDLLGLGTLTHIHKTLDLVRETRGVDLSLATIPAEDPATYEMICRADTVGVFQIESRAQMSMLPRLRPKTFYDLVVEVAIVRPGPISGGMVHPYLKRRTGEETVEYPHDCLKPVLAKTLGVPLFQEQVMKLAVVAADYTPGEADQLRRDMAAWKSTGKIERHRERLVSRMKARGIAPEFAERVYQQILGFGEYGFPESHAASFALLAYATAWLKCHHPAEFACALLNSLPMGFYSAATIVEDAKRHGVVVLPVDATTSGWDCSIETATTNAEQPSSSVRIGLRFARGLSPEEGERIVAARRERAFASLDDVARRTRLDRGAMARLAEAGAFEALGGRSRRGDLWSVLAPPQDARGRLPLDLAERGAEFASLDAFDTIGWDYRATHLSPRGHPLEPLRDRLRAQRLPDAAEVARTPHGRHVRYAGLVICRQRPGTASGVLFMTLEDETGFVNLVVWPRAFEAHSVLVRTASFLGVSGKVQNEKGVVHVIAESFWTPTIDASPPAPASHDFR
jgi:error-prone DNA polymerase